MSTQAKAATRAPRPKRTTGKTRCKGVWPKVAQPHRGTSKLAMAAGGGTTSGAPSISSTTLQGTVLVTSGNDGQGNNGSGAVDLDTILGNTNGGFVWGGTNFSNKAKNIRLSAPQQSGLITLSADLPDKNGDYHTSTVQIAQDVGQFWDDPVALRTALSVPSGVPLGKSETIDQADQKVLDQVDAPDKFAPVTDVQTLSTSQVQAIKNGTSDLVNNNGPAAGAALSVISITYHTAVIANGLAEAQKAGSCTIL